MTEYDPNDLPLSMVTKMTVDPETDCWVWFAASNGRYGMSWYPRAKRTVMAHRRSYEAVVGDVPTGLELDHLCRNTLCVNPAHLEPVTRNESIRRRYLVANPLHDTHFACGHERAGNTRFVWATKATQAWRLCVRCQRSTGRQSATAEQREAVAACPR